jgi:methylmalonyl-CoA epimerase
MSELAFSIQEVVVAVTDIDAAAQRLGGAMNAKIDQTVSYPQSGIEIEMGGIWVDDFRIALVKDSGGTGPVSKFIENRGEGLYEVCLRTADLPAAIDHMKAAGMRFVSEEPHSLRDYEWHGEIFSEVKVVFVHPASSHGVLIELQQWIK